MAALDDDKKESGPQCEGPKTTIHTQYTPYIGGGTSCPNCGYCPSCGRSNAPCTPYNPNMPMPGQVWC